MIIQSINQSINQRLIIILISCFFPVQKSPSHNQDIFTFTRYPSRTDNDSSGPSLTSPRHVGDDESDESNSDGSSVMDEEEVVRINFGDSFHNEKGASEPCDDDNSTTTDDEEDSEQPAEIRNIVGKNDWSEAEVAVENWKRAREQRKSDSSAGNSSSGESGTLYCQKTTSLMVTIQSIN